MERDVVDAILVEKPFDEKGQKLGIEALEALLAVRTAELEKLELNRIELASAAAAALEDLETWHEAIAEKCKGCTTCEHVIPALRAGLERAVQQGLPGYCRQCGCTEDFGCENGCAWVDAEHTLCSACAGAGIP